MAFAEVLAWAQTQPVGSVARTLADAYVSGTLRVTMDGRSVEYRSLSDLERALSALSVSVGGLSPRRLRAVVARVGSPGGW